MKFVMFLLAGVFASSMAHAVPVEVQVNNVLVKTAGPIIINIYDSAKSWEAKRPKPDHSYPIPVTVGTTTTVLELPPGRYGFIVYQDLDNNGELNQTWVGFPNEPYAFGNDFQLRFSKPTFTDISVPVTAQGGQFIVHLNQP